jgi:myo-inositol-1(or 4)-monophosphatase
MPGHYLKSDMKQFIIDVVKGAGAIVKKGYQTEMKVSTKSGRFDVVTEYDLASEKYIIDRIRKKFSGHGVLAEESGHIVNKKNLWLIDPIDGTGSFIRGLPQFSVCVAFVSNNVIKMSAIYEPIRDELFFAEKGRGAFLNGRKVSIGRKTDLDHAWIARQGRRNSGDSKQKKVIDRVMDRKGLVLARTGSTQLSGAYTACGRYDILLVQGLNPWDIAAAALLLSEAGAKVTALDGKPYRWDMDNVLGANPKLHKLLLKQLKR